MLVSSCAGICMAGETTISGTASCVMPDLFGYTTAALAPKSTSAPAEATAPIASGASGKFDVSKKEKLIQTEDNAVIENDAGSTKVTLYTICAR